MAEYGEWDIGGLTPQYIHDDGVDWKNYPTITLHCIAFGIEGDPDLSDARDIINQYKALASEEINIVQLYKTGKDIQTVPANNLITIKEGNTSWSGALYYPQFDEKDFAKLPSPVFVPILGIHTTSVIEFDLKIELVPQSETIDEEEPEP
jgi:hypothetical protein